MNKNLCLLWLAAIVGRRLMEGKQKHETITVGTIGCQITEVLYWYGYLALALFFNNFESWADLSFGFRTLVAKSTVFFELFNIYVFILANMLNPCGSRAQPGRRAVWVFIFWLNGLRWSCDFVALGRLYNSFSIRFGHCIQIIILNTNVVFL